MLMLYELKAIDDVQRTGINSPNKLLATIWVKIFNFTELKTDRLEYISASTQSGQSLSPQKRNF